MRDHGGKHFATDRHRQARTRTDINTLIAGVLLTAGESSRMGRPKALLPFKQTTFSRSILAALKRAGVRPIQVVVGNDPGPIITHLADLSIQFVYNRNWPKGQLSSLQAAIRACPRTATGMLVALVDQPGLRPRTVRRLISRHRREPRAILVASFRGRAGHPVVFPRYLFRELLSAPLSKGARVVVRRHAASRIFVEVSDPAVVRDVDTRRDYRSIRRITYS